MNPLALITDSYERKARLYPALIAMLPALLIVVLLLPANLSALQAAGAVIASCGGAFLLSQLARRAGKRCERRLFQRWGGMPSVAIFRHRDTTIDSITKARYHKKLAALVQETKAPSAAQEASHPKEADRVYAAWSTYLRSKTRDAKQYPLLFRENVNFGFHRNLYGLRPLGILSCTIASLCIAGWGYWLYRTTQILSAEYCIAFAITLAFLLLWVFSFTADSVHIPANAYAERLAEAVETFNDPGTRR